VDDDNVHLRGKANKDAAKILCHRLLEIRQAQLKSGRGWQEEESGVGSVDDNRFDKEELLIIVPCFVSFFFSSYLFSVFCSVVILRVWIVIA
jgi:hypothetical protein